MFSLSLSLSPSLPHSLLFGSPILSPANWNASNEIEAKDEGAPEPESPVNNDALRSRSGRNLKKKGEKTIAPPTYLYWMILGFQGL